MEIITKLGAEKYLQYQHDFGFGEKTGIDLPNEASASNLLYSLSNLHSAEMATSCLLYTSDAADEEDSGDFDGRRIIEKKKKSIGVRGGENQEIKKERAHND